MIFFNKILFNAKNTKLRHTAVYTISMGHTRSSVEQKKKNI